VLHAIKFSICFLRFFFLSFRVIFCFINLHALLSVSVYFDRCSSRDRSSAIFDTLDRCYSLSRKI
jgi:hypothetical protein